MIKRLGSKLCQIDENLLTEKALMQKSSKSGSKKLSLDTSKVQDEEAASSSLKGKAKVTSAKKVLKKTLKPRDEDSEIQDEDGGPTLPEREAPRKAPKN